MKIPYASPKRQGRIEIIPLIDIIFFLLATFVMVSLSMVQNRGIPVTLPRAATGQGREKAPSIVTVTVTDAGRFFLNKAPVGADALDERLRALRREQSDLRVVFNGDEKASFGDVVRALDQARKAGVEKVAIQTAADAG